MNTANPMTTAIICQFIFMASGKRTTAAILGFLITTGILLWGNMIYSQGGSIALFGTNLSKPAFIGWIIGWYLFDLKALYAALKPVKAAHREEADQQRNDSNVSQNGFAGIAADNGNPTIAVR